MSYQQLKHATGQRLAASASKVPHVQHTHTQTDGEMDQGCMVSEPDHPAVLDLLSHGSQSFLAQTAAGRQALHPSCPDHQMPSIDTATKVAYKIPTAGKVSALEDFPLPSSQLLEDSPMELWQYSESAVASPCATDTCLKSAQPAVSATAEALRELEDFCKCTLRDRLCLSVLSLPSCKHMR